MQYQITPSASNYLEGLAQELDVPPSRYDEARRRYKSVAEWLDREESTLKELEPDVYVQGSFRLGTPIRPINEDEHYDIDLVCELNVPKDGVSQETLKQMLGDEMRAYAKAHNMSPPGEGRRCWTLDYAEGAQFHLDALPAIPDGSRKTQVLAARSLNSTWSSTAIAITDVDHPSFKAVVDEWPHSNPKGFTNWFRSRMAVVFEKQRAAMALQVRASVEDVPSYKVRTPLQQAVQVLKRHRDHMFADDPADKPISVIITTLSGLSYSNEGTVAQALGVILSRMPVHIKERNGVTWIENPTDPEENFADRWASNPNLKKRFHDWLAAARRDFILLGSQNSRDALVQTASSAFGSRAARAAGAPTRQMVLASPIGSRLLPILGAKHRQVAPWSPAQSGKVKIIAATVSGSGFRPKKYFNDGAFLDKRKTLTFRADTDVPGSFDVYWQVVNTGPQAAAENGGLRGTFDKGQIQKGTILHEEHTTYAGTHSIECFIVKGNYLAARSGPFIVNVL